MESPFRPPAPDAKCSTLSRRNAHFISIKGFPYTHRQTEKEYLEPKTLGPGLHSMNLFNGYFKFPLTNHQYANAVPIKLLNGMCFAFYHKGFN